jgi:hypothetical protein
VSGNFCALGSEHYYSLYLPYNTTAAVSVKMTEIQLFSFELITIATMAGQGRKEGRTDYGLYDK